MLPSRTFTPKGGACSGGKQRKDRVTVPFGANATGEEKLLLLVIGKDLETRYFRNARLPNGIIYRATKAAWMTATLFEELCQEVIKLNGNGAAEGDVTFLEYVLCEQDVPVGGEMTDAEVVQTATNGGDSREDEPPREVPTSAETRNLLRLLRNKVERSGGEDQLMRCIKQLKDAFL
ncbi:hypothetical protein HPB50_027029 [Hyalomma asiaticum]|uniref:Uncharacterized protein n=1 Tax=Hyalomma asiaticum TaxID=266040 RepID=A0ACB7RQQ6_HYAAI|nr:hypothetical protein HPB50_027029 [Hyalomma asiaticum]